MPTFDFRCTACGNTFEFTRAFGSKDHPSCPACKSKKTEKLLSPPSVHFKGGGFYKTDSGGKKHMPAKEVKKSDGKEKAALPSEASPSTKEKPSSPAQNAPSANEKPKAPDR